MSEAQWTLGEALAELHELNTALQERNRTIKRANQAGVPINQIHEITGLARTTIYRILGR